MKCAFINLGKHYGGAEHYLLTIVTRWVELGHDAVVIAKKQSLFLDYLSKKLPEVKKIAVDYCLKDIKMVRNIMNDENVDVFNVNGINSGIFANLVNVKKAPRITTVHSNAEMDRADRSFFIRKLFVMAENYCLMKSNQIIAVSEAIKKILVNRGLKEDTITVIENGIRTIDYPVRSYREKEDEELRICYVGRLEKVKGCEILLRALNEIKNLNFKCDIYGEGSLKGKLMNYAAENEMLDNVNFMGFSDKIRELLSQYDALVLPSLYEASPLTIPEAMNARTLLVCSNVGGIPWIIKDGINGYLFEKEDYQKLSEIISYIYDYPEKQSEILNTAYTEFMEKYTEDIMIENTFSVFYSMKAGE